jgi:hypothetical protein
MTSRNPEFGAAADRFTARAVRTSPAAARGPTEFSNESREVPEHPKNLLTNGIIT